MIEVIVALFLVVVVLLQRSEGGGIVSGGTGSLMSVRGAGDLLTRTTWILGTIFFVLALLLTIVAGRQRGAGSVVDRLKVNAINPVELQKDAAQPPAGTAQPGARRQRARAAARPRRRPSTAPSARCPPPRTLPLSRFRPERSRPPRPGSSPWIEAQITGSRQEIRPRISPLLLSSCDHFPQTEHDRTGRLAATLNAHDPRSTSLHHRRRGLPPLGKGLASAPLLAPLLQARGYKVRLRKPRPLSECRSRAR